MRAKKMRFGRQTVLRARNEASNPLLNGKEKVNTDVRMLRGSSYMRING